MTDEEVLKMYEDMLEYFGELPNPEHEPRRFAHYVKVYKYYKEKYKSSTLDFEEDYYFIEFIKNRHDQSGTIVPLQALPQHAEFLIPDVVKTTEMLKWIGGYIRAVS